MLDNFESLKVRNVIYSKPIAFVINPNSGKKINKVQKIKDFLKDNGIPCEFLETQKAGDSFTIPNEMDIDKYSAVISCGGDGTLFEVVNGMLLREDGKKIPVGVIPNGSGNCGASGVGIRDTDMALETIKAATVLKHDITRLMLDTEDPSSIPKGAASFKKTLAYSIVGIQSAD